MEDLIAITDSLYQLNDKDFVSLFSKERVNSIGGKISYQNYYECSKALYPAIHTIEVILRNKIDKVLCKYNPKSPSWIMDLFFYINQNHLNTKKESDIEKIKESIAKVVSKLDRTHQYSSVGDFWNRCQNKSSVHSILISRLSFGFWILILKNEKLFCDIHQTSIDLAKTIFPILANKISKNPSLFFSFLHNKSRREFQIKANKKTKKLLSASEKTIILVSFLNSIRNRLVHCEFLFKRGESITTKVASKNYYFDGKRKNIKKYLITILEEFSRNN